MNKQLFTSNKQDWETPKEVFDKLNKEFNFELDAAANEQNAKCDLFFTEKDDALKQDWSCFKSIFINPPYTAKTQDKFVEKAYKTHKKNGNTIVLIIPARTDTKRWHDYILGKAEVRFLKGRLYFEVNGKPCKNAAPFSSAIVVYGGESKNASSIKSADFKKKEEQQSEQHRSD